MKLSYVTVLCCLCGRQWLAMDPRVLYRSCDGRWWCADEAGCKDRHLANLAAMQRGLDQAWGVLDTLAALEAEGWRLIP